jgi:hypothetical protein
MKTVTITVGLSDAERIDLIRLLHSTAQDNTSAFQPTAASMKRKFQEALRPGSEETGRTGSHPKGNRARRSPRRRTEAR